MPPIFPMMFLPRKAMLIAAQAREATKDVAIVSKNEHIARKDERIEKLVAAFKKAAFGRKSEKTDPDQFDLALEDLEAAMAVIHAEDEDGLKLFQSDGRVEIDNNSVERTI